MDATNKAEEVAEVTVQFAVNQKVHVMRTRWITNSFKAWRDYNLNCIKEVGVLSTVVPTSNPIYLAGNERSPHGFSRTHLWDLWYRSG